MKDKIRPIYSELKGILSQAPDRGDILYDDKRDLWERFNKLVENLKIQAANEDFSDYILQPRHTEYGEMLSVDTYRAKISGLISRLYGTYFADELEPFTGVPSSITNVSQNQNVSVQVYIELGMQIQSALDKAESPQEKSFIEGLKDKVSTVKSFIDFGLLMTSLSSQYGITPERIKTLFGY